MIYQGNVPKGLFNLIFDESLRGGKVSEQSHISPGSDGNKVDHCGESSLHLVACSVKSLSSW
jgi:hypothetical protein